MAAGWRWSLDRVLSDRPAIRVNQLGYVVGRPMRATLVSSVEAPVGFELRNDRGDAIFSGTSMPWSARPESSSGFPVHVIDFTGSVVQPGIHRLVSGELGSHPFSIGPDHARLAADALRVFTLLRSGWAIDEAAHPGYGRPAGHLGVLPNRGDTAVPAWTGPEAERLYPGWRPDAEFDVSGGWYDAGDYGKYVTSGAIAAWQLLSTLDLLDRVGPAVPGLADGIVAEVRWQVDWLLRMQVPAGDPLAGMAFHRVHGTEWSPLPGFAHEDPTPRVLHRPSTSATLHLAAVGAQAARRWTAADPDYARRLLDAARTAWVAARRNPDLIAPDDHARFGGGPYGDDDPSDDFYWAAVELWLTTGQTTYAEAVARSPWHGRAPADEEGFDFDRVAVPAMIDLALLGPEGELRDVAVAAISAHADRLGHLQQQQAWGQPYAPPTGWGWGSNGRLLNNVVVLIAAARLTGERRHADAAYEAVDYVFGRNALGQSYVTGYGVDFSRHQRTRQFGRDLDPRFPPTPPGALAGGANSQPSPDFDYDARLLGLPPQLCYLDEPTSEVTNDICIRWNAPLVHVAAYLATTAPVSGETAQAR